MSMIDANELIRLGQAAKSNGDNAQALQYFQQALQLHPDELSLQTVCGNLCVYLSRFEEAAGYFRRILHVNKSPEARNALCYALNGLGNQADREGQYILAEACFEEALSHQPQNAGYWYNLGNAQRELGKPIFAGASFLKATQYAPDDANAFNNLGNIQCKLGQLDAGIASYKEALRLQPNLHHALSHLIHQRQHICDWQGEGDDALSAQVSKIRQVVSTQTNAQVSPFAFLAMPDTTAEEQLQCASHYATQNFSQLYKLQPSLGFKHDKKAKAQLKIGYLSADFRQHPLAFLITDLIESHDRKAFNVYAYSYGDVDDSAERKRLVSAFDVFRDIRQMNDIDAARQINQDDIDILIDLTGYTQSSRTALIALKPAAIHINWLGYPGTMGSIYQETGETTPLFDYIITDPIITPDSDGLSEKPIYLPCYQPNSFRETASDSPKSAHNLPEAGFIFCCFNQTFKITPDIFTIWMRLLKQVPDSVLWLMDCNQWAKENLCLEAEQSGIASDRLIFAERTHAAAHIERQRHADLFLDTQPYNAHTTASDAIWAGLPIITCKGQTFASRVSASLLSHIGLTELVSSSLASYEAKALHLAQHPKELHKLKETLKQSKIRDHLFNSVSFAQRLETEFQQIWQSYLDSPSD